MTTTLTASEHNPTWSTFQEALIEEGQARGLWRLEDGVVRLNKAPAVQPSKQAADIDASLRALYSLYLSSEGQRRQRKQGEFERLVAANPNEAWAKAYVSAMSKASPEASQAV